MKKIILFLSISSFTFLVLAQETCYNFDNACSDQVLERANQALFIDEADRQAIIDKHFPWRVPQSPGSPIKIYVQNHYIIGFDTQLNVPLWVGYYLSKEQATSNLSRVNCFREDPRTLGKPFHIECDFFATGFNRGHMAPNGDFTQDEIMMANTYMLTNMAPQRAMHNQSTWRWFEEYVRTWAKIKDGVFVITGVAYDEDGNGAMDDREDVDNWMNNKMAIPTHFYKIIINERADGFLETLALLTPHDNIKRKKNPTYKFLQSQCIVSIDKIEQLSGLDFLSTHPNQDAVERFKATELWGKKYRPGRD